MSGTDITLKSPDGPFTAYLASPAAGRGPGVVVIQEIFGVNDVMRGIADGFAERGYFALVPDLFWRMEPNVRLSDRTDAEWKKAFDLMGRFDKDKGIGDVQLCIEHLRKLPAANGKVGTVGYCLGGLLAFLSAARTDSDASVGYYGVSIQDYLGEAANIRKRLVLHIAGKDEFVPAEAQQKIADGLKGNPLVTIHRYPEMDHAFARAGGAHYDKANAELANGRTATFFRQHLS